MNNETMTREQIERDALALVKRLKAESYFNQELEYWKLPRNRPNEIIAVLEEYTANPQDVDVIALRLRKMYRDLFCDEIAGERQAAGEYEPR